MSHALTYRDIPSTKRQREQLLKAFRMRTGRGLTELVARRYRVQGGLVSRVFHGLATSARIRTALLKEMDKAFGAQDQRKPAQAEGNGGRSSLP